ncbi:aldehyde oxidoreductase [Halobacteriales archaeon QS_8_69_26]|nr:MAG: aldehyde oxidoreductase [Halobacteriales archaeon QS_8_69_26]
MPSPPGVRGVTRIPRPGLGTSGAEGETCTRSVEAALEMGYRHVDTAQMYDNERAVGDGIARSSVDREEVFLATKVHPDNLAPEDVRETTTESLERLGVDRVDLLYVHWPIRAYEPSETLPAFDDLRAAGATEAVGVSNFSPDLLAEAVELLDAPVLANQFECHPLLPQAELRSACADHGATPVAYAPVLQGEADEVPELREVADRHDATPAQVSIAWLLEKGTVPIPKGTGDHVRENWAARDLSLTDEDVRTIDGIDRRRRLVDPDPAPWNR